MTNVLNVFRQVRSRDFPYFRRVYNTIVVTLLAISLIPTICSSKITMMRNGSGL